MSALNRRAARSVISAPIYVKWRGASGRTYQFELNHVGTPYNPHPGVYIFCHFGERNLMVADYLDVTDDFSQRIGETLAEHRHWEEIKASGATHICTLHVPGPVTARVQVERDIRREVMPGKKRFAA